MSQLSFPPRWLLILALLFVSAANVQCRPLDLSFQDEPVIRAGGAVAGARALLQIPPGNFELLIGETTQLDKYGRGAILAANGVETWAMTKQIVNSLQSAKKGKLPSSIATFGTTTETFPPPNTLTPFTQKVHPPPSSFQMIPPPTGFTAYVGKSASGVYVIWDPNWSFQQGNQALTGSTIWYYGMTTRVKDPGAVPLVSVTDGLTLNLASDVGQFVNTLSPGIVWCKLDQAVV